MVGMIQFVLRTGGGVYYLSAVVTWLILIGGMYGCVRLAIDVWRTFRQRATLVPMLSEAEVQRIASAAADALRGTEPQSDHR
jgi:hypothetical protein